MRRAYKQIVGRRGPLADTIVALYESGVIGKRFTASQIEHKLVGVFSDSEIRTGLAEHVGNQWRVPADKRFKSLEKYRYEIVLSAGTSSGTGDVR